MLNFEPNNWYVYILHNTSSNWFYIGLHHQLGNNSYSHSSSSVALKQAIEDGKVKDYIVFKTKDSEKASALETYLINTAKQHDVKLYNNNSGGGHKGGARQSILTESDYKVGEDMLINNIFPKIYNADEYLEMNAKFRKLAEEVGEAVVVQLDAPNEVVHKVTYEPIDLILNLPFLQITENAVDRNEVARVVEAMMRDVVDAKRQVEPATIVVYPNGAELRIDGTTTCYAIKDCNIWATVPVVRMSSDVFENQQYWMETYASARNTPKKYKKTKDPKKELKARIRTFHNLHQEMFENNFEDFCTCFIASQDRLWSPKQISSNLNSYQKDYYEDVTKGDNWLNYKINESTIINKISSAVMSKFPKSITTKVSVSNLEREAVSNPGVYFGNGPGGKDTEIILAHHTTTDTETQEEYHFNRLANCFAVYNFYPDKSKAMYGYTPFVGRHNGIKIFVIFLPSRIDTMQFGSIADNIVNSLFENQKIAA